MLVVSIPRFLSLFSNAAGLHVLKPCVPAGRRLQPPTQRCSMQLRGSLFPCSLCLTHVFIQLGDGGSPTFIGTVAWWGSLTEQQAAEGGVDTWPEGLDAEAGVCSNSYDGPDRVVLMQRNVGRDVIWYMRTKVEELQAAGLEYPCE